MILPVSQILSSVKMRFSFKANLYQLVSSNKSRKKGSPNMSLLYKLKILNMPEAMNSHGKMVNISESCQVKISSAAIPFGQTAILNVVLVFEGLVLHVHGKDSIMFKFRKQESRIHREADEYNCELEPDIDLELAIDQLNKPTQSSKTQKDKAPSRKRRGRPKAGKAQVATEAALNPETINLDKGSNFL